MIKPKSISSSSDSALMFIVSYLCCSVPLSSSSSAPPSSSSSAPGHPRLLALLWWFAIRCGGQLRLLLVHSAVYCLIFAPSSSSSSSSSGHHFPLPLYCLISAPWCSSPAVSARRGGKWPWWFFNFCAVRGVLQLEVGRWSISDSSITVPYVVFCAVVFFLGQFPVGRWSISRVSVISTSSICCIIEPLTATDLSRIAGDNSKVRVAYQGVPGLYSEDAALKAYPKCQTVPCDEFEAAFQAVELWLVDKVVLPIENTLGGSIHRNYDLLLRHRLHIVGEVQLAVNHCLLGLPGVRKEELKRVLSHPQALDQCEMKLSELGLMRIKPGVAQIMASEGVRDTGAIASARAATIYGLDVLQEKMQ